MIAIRTLAVIAALAAAGLAAAPAQAADRCGHRKARTIRQTARVRVYEGDFGVFACARATGRRVHLYDDDGEYDLGEIDLIRGDFVAYDWVRYPTCKDACPPGVTVDEVQEATGFALATDGAVPESRTPTEEELRLIRDVIDPQGLRNAEVKSA